MARVYFEKLTQLVTDLDITAKVPMQLEVKHFFNGAALYADRVICASWSPGGLAFKLPQSEVEDLITSGKAVPLKYFEKGRVKKGYAMFQHPEAVEQSHWKTYFLKAVKQHDE